MAVAVLPKSALRLRTETRMEAALEASGISTRPLTDPKPTRVTSRSTVSPSSSSTIPPALARTMPVWSA